MANRNARFNRRGGRRGHTPPVPTTKKRGLADAWPRLAEDLSLAAPDVASWEGFDATALFDETPRLHVNKVTYTDDRVDTDDTDSSTPEKGHEDEVTVGQGNPEGEADERELQADAEEGEPPGGQPNEASSSPEAPAEGADASEAEGQPDAEAGEPEDEAAPPESESQDEDGTENPIQKESEGVEDVAEATSKTSEDVHGGNEATKDIEDSPNAANDGQNPDNHGAEAGEDGEEGNDSSGSEADDAEAEAGAESTEDTDGMAEEDWEASADHSASHLAFENSLDEFEAKVRQETGHRTSMPSYQFDRDESPAELEVAFKKGRELIQKLAAEEDYTRRVAGTARWEATELARAAVSYRHARIPSAKFDRPREADIVMLLDISGSCAQQAEMFMAIAAGAVGNGVRIYVGYNGSARAAALTPPRRPLRSYSQAKAWVQSEMDRVSGWENAYAIGEWSFDRFVEEVWPKTCIIFGDWDGMDQYQLARRQPKFRSTRFFWFANEGVGRRAERADTVPEGWTRKSYFPAIYRPQDLVRALRKTR